MWRVNGSSDSPEPLVLLDTGQDVGSAPFSYRIADGGGIELLQHALGGVSSIFPYEDYPAYFPQAKASLVALDIHAEAAIYAENRQDATSERFLTHHRELDMPRHQVGGEPWLVQKSVSLAARCPICGDIMPRLAAIGDDCLDERGFTGEPFVQVLYHYCKRCAVVSCFNQTD